MHRRQYLRRVAATGALGAATTAGCTSLGGGSGGGGNPNTVLPKPELDAEPEAYPFPQWSQQLPEVTLPAALRDRSVTTTEFDTPLALTFIFTNCMTACPVLTLALQRAQRAAIEDGYADAVNFAEITFDPARDTPEAFREYADERHVDLDAGNWYFLRPDSEDRAREVVDGEFGVFYERATPTATQTGDGTPGGADAGTPRSSTATDATTTAGQTPAAGDGASEGGYMFNHTTLILLVNGDDYVERAYRERNDATTQLTKDVERLVEA